MNSFLARYDFHQCRQKEEESVDEFISRLRVIAGKCKFTPAEQPVRLVEQLIIATKHVEVQSKLLEKGDKLDLDTAMDIARTYEATKQHVAQMQKPVQTSVRTVSTHRTCSRCGKQHADKNELCPTHEKNVTRVARRDICYPFGSTRTWTQHVWTSTAVHGKEH